VKAIVIGAGIGGLTAAMALHADGNEVTVYESVRELLPLGVGINVLPHAMGVLDGLGLRSLIEPLGLRTAELCFFNRHGQLIWREPRGLAAGYPVPQLSLHRGRLQVALFEEASRRLGEGSIRLGMALRSFTTGSSSERPTVEIDVRVDATTLHDSADIVIAADGIHSTARAAFYPDQGPPNWSGNLLWRAVTVGKPFLTGASMFMAGFLKVKFVAYPITEPDADGNQLLNWIAELDRQDQGLSGREDWNKRVDKSVFAEHFKDWTFDWLDVPALIAGGGDVFEFPMVDRDPLPKWTHGRVTLLGDAAHPMFPIGSNGASQAVLDARALADSIRECADLDDALAAYESKRRPATAEIVMNNRRHGPEVVLDLAEERAPNGFADVSDVFAAGELEEISSSYKRVAGFTRPTA
jgi:5-methylphenazine-1-carboxylate 1-monooxygenase